MKKWRSRILGIGILALLLYFVPLPCWTNVKLEGIICKTDNSEYEEPAVFALRGWTLRYLFKKDIFRGRMFFETNHSKLGADKVEAELEKEQGIWKFKPGYCAGFYSGENRLIEVSHNEDTQDFLIFIWYSDIYLDKFFRKGLVLYNKDNIYTADKVEAVFAAPAASREEVENIFMELEKKAGKKFEE